MLTKSSTFVKIIYITINSRVAQILCNHPSWLLSPISDNCKSHMVACQYETRRKDETCIVAESAQLIVVKQKGQAHHQQGDPGT